MQNYEETITILKKILNGEIEYRSIFIAYNKAESKEEGKTSDQFKARFVLPGWMDIFSDLGIITISTIHEDYFEQNVLLKTDLNEFNKEQLFEIVNLFVFLMDKGIFQIFGDIPSFIIKFFNKFNVPIEETIKTFYVYLKNKEKLLDIKNEKEKRSYIVKKIFYTLYNLENDTEMKEADLKFFDQYLFDDQFSVSELCKEIFTQKENTLYFIEHFENRMESIKIFFNIFVKDNYYSYYATFLNDDSLKDYFLKEIKDENFLKDKKEKDLVLILFYLILIEDPNPKINQLIKTLTEKILKKVGNYMLIHQLNIYFTSFPTFAFFKFFVRDEDFKNKNNIANVEVAFNSEYKYFSSFNQIDLVLTILQMIKKKTFSYKNIVLLIFFTKTLFERINEFILMDETLKKDISESLISIFSLKNTKLTTPFLKRILCFDSRKVNKNSLLSFVNEYIKDNLDTIKNAENKKKIKKIIMKNYI